ncbi:hypothetical protein Q4567_14045 [Aliiglaciecola sp. 2_MG-2023]|uniref:hypothetical protein n=1 Tax=unclassified Aliiglaciecola TaxID=2593648 RepID=UPI0026E4061E|nr:MULTISPECIES: hypothetical protein [unclassified Aliiglaciecola]MDO6711851.1 hypothetical protein [Aliiglaciecola sp. 2_MG-2023]MDO6752975.1 hypothetical protein [Aliiglaciecola sp. 1_MG-2023]
MQEHGEHVIGKCGQVLLFSGRGPWNDEALEGSLQQTIDNFHTVDKNRPWAQLSCLYGESLFPPSTYNLFKKQTFLRKQLGITAVAVVILDSDISNTIKQQLSTGYQAAEVNYQFFSSLVDAIHWLENHGVDIDANAITQFFNQNRL